MCKAIEMDTHRKKPCLVQHRFTFFSLGLMNTCQDVNRNISIVHCDLCGVQKDPCASFRPKIDFAGLDLCTLLHQVDMMREDPVLSVHQSTFYSVLAKRIQV